MIIPSIDLIDGQVVRLYQGNYKKKKIYTTSADTLIKIYSQQKISYIHIVDLDAAKNPNKRQLKKLKNLINRINVPIQIGGGIRNKQHIEELLEIGAKRVVIGSIAIKKPEKLYTWIKEYGPETIVLSLDVLLDKHNQKIITTNAWTQVSKFVLEDIIKLFANSKLKHVLCTDTSKDGTLNGPNFLLYKEITEKFKNIYFQSSGGINTISDVITLKKIKLKGIIIGRALLENHFSLLEAIEC